MTLRTVVSPIVRLDARWDVKGVALAQVVVHPVNLVVMGRRVAKRGSVADGDRCSKQFVPRAFVRHHALAVVSPPHLMGAPDDASKRSETVTWGCSLHDRCVDPGQSAANAAQDGGSGVLRMRDLVKRAARFVLGDYQINRIYAISLADVSVRNLDAHLAPGQRLAWLTEKDLESASEERLRRRRWLCGADAYGFGLWEGDLLVSMCWCWNHRRSLGSIWSLNDDEAALVDIITAESHRGRGLAPVLIQFASQELKKMNIRRLYAWIWHNHRASLRSFEKSGWTYCAFVTEVNLFRLRRLRFVHRVS